MINHKKINSLKEEYFLFLFDKGNQKKMNTIHSKIFIVLSLLFAATNVFAQGQHGSAVTITDPPNGAVVSSPVKVCMSTEGVKVQPAKKGVNEGKGHHHIIVDVELPKDLSKPIGKDANHIHMGDGSTCKEIKLSVGKHIIRTLFAKGNHVPYNSPLTATITVNVK